MKLIAKLKAWFKPPDGPLPAEHCLLSEFDGPRLRWLRVARSKNAARWMALGCFLWAALMLWLGDRLQANAMGLGFQATTTLSDGTTITGSTKLIYGWMAQINEGLFYLVMGPVMILMTHRFLIACGQALRQLHGSGRLRVTGAADNSWSEEMARRSRCSAWTLWTFPLFLLICLNTQLPSINRTMKGYPTARPEYVIEALGMKTNWVEIGYIQSLNFTRWTNDFQRTTVMSQVEALKQVGCLNGLAAGLFAELDRTNRLEDAALKPFLNYHAGKPQSLRLDLALLSSTNMTVSARAIWPEIKPTKWLPGKKFFEEVLKGRGVITEGEQRERYVWWFKTFIILSQIQIAAFFTFMTWLLWKIVFWLVQVYRMLPQEQEATAATPPDADKERKKPAILFRPVVDDPGGRYGLGALFRPYNLLVLVVALGSSFSALHFPDGAGIRAITDAEGAGNGATRIGHLFAISAAITAVLIGPLWLYPARLRRWAEAGRLKTLHQELKPLTDKEGEQRKKLLEEESVILDQSTWPRGDNRFRFTIVIVFAVLLLPVGTAFEFLPGDITPFTRLPQVLRSACKDMAAHIYHVGQTEEDE